MDLGDGVFCLDRVGCAFAQSLGVFWPFVGRSQALAGIQNVNAKLLDSGMSHR